MAQAIEGVFECAFATEALNCGLFVIVVQPIDAGVTQRIGQRQAFGWLRGVV